MGIGYHMAKPIDYGEAYFDDYLNRDRSEMGDKLTAARVKLVSRHVDPVVCVDIGIGGGAFVRAADCAGFDVNPHAINWLSMEGRFVDPYIRGYKAFCLWDSLEHIQDPSILLGCVEDFVFVSIPIFRDVEHVLSSRHYKPGEHIWYFTDAGLKRYMDNYGFDCIEQNNMETELGRDGIGSYVFRRK